MSPTRAASIAGSSFARTAALPAGSPVRAIASSEPQIAARAHHHIVVAKGAREGVTTADTRVLEGDERVLEIARMLGGDPESTVSQAHARELLATAAVPEPTRAPRRSRKR